MQIIPLQAVPSQKVTVTLSNQTCRIKVYTLTTGLFCDLYVNDALIIGGVVCLNKNLLVRSLYLGFTGDLAFFDTVGLLDPTYKLIGTRFYLAYFFPSEVGAL